MTLSNTDNSKRFKIELAAVAAISFFLLVVVPLLAPYGVTSGLWGKYLSYALLAISVDLLWGSTGLLSLGQALFFSIGGYMHGMYLMRMIGELGQYKKPIPDFLVFLGWTKLPAFWEPFSSFGFAMFMVVLVPALVAYVFGYLAFRSRIKGVYFSILTQALTYAASIIFFRNNLLMGGNNGFTDFKFILGHSLVDKVQGPKTMTALYVVTGVTLLLVYLFRRWLRTTKFGLVQQAIRDGENRTLFSGYATEHYKLFVFVLCAVIASIGGALYVPQAAIINPEEMRTANSLEAVVWVAVGGRGTLFGPILGAVFVNALKSWATQGVTANYWPIIIGGLCIGVVLFLPGGLVSLPARLAPLWKRMKRPGSQEIAPPPTPKVETVSPKS
ncbi:MAG: urea ABC transporter permease subunit UrtC [Nibricoccus sp.]